MQGHETRNSDQKLVLVSELLAFFPHAVGLPVMYCFSGGGW